jgi:hypothetical protein
MAKLANPARVAVSPQGAPEEHKQSWWRAVMAWGMDTVFGAAPGYDVKLLESNGRGSDSFDRAAKRSEREMIIAVAGQEVTTDGGAGFQNSDIHKSIRADLIKATADALAYTINTQGIPQWVVTRWGEEALAESACVEWDVKPPRDRNMEATAAQTTGNAVDLLTKALAAYGYELEIQEFMDRQGVRIVKKAKPAGVVAEETENGEDAGAEPPAQLGPKDTTREAA